MNTRTMGYWATTGLFGAVYLASGLADVFHAAPVVATVAHLGYPAFLPSILGPWKVAGALTVLAPRAARMKEWAYAGVVFDLTGAAISHGLTHDPIAKIVIPLVLLALVVASYLLRPASRRLAAPAASRDERTSTTTTTGAVPSYSS